MADSHEVPAVPSGLAPDADSPTEENRLREALLDAVKQNAIADMADDAARTAALEARANLSYTATLVAAQLQALRLYYRRTRRSVQ